MHPARVSEQTAQLIVSIWGWKHEAFDRKEADMRLLRAVPLALVLVLCSGAVGAAHDANGHGRRADFVPVHRLGGARGSELIGQWWARVIEIPNAQNPLGA